MAGNRVCQEMRKKKDKPKIPQKFSLWIKENWELALKEKKKKNLFHWKIIDFECWQDFRTEMTFKGQDTALKF